MFGLEVAAVMLPSEVLMEDRVSRMNELWDLLGEHEALVIAVSAARVRGTSLVRSCLVSGIAAPIAGRH